MVEFEYSPEEDKYVNLNMVKYFEIIDRSDNRGENWAIVAFLNDDNNTDQCATAIEMNSFETRKEAKMYLDKLLGLR